MNSRSQSRGISKSKQGSISYYDRKGSWTCKASIPQKTIDKLTQIQKELDNKLDDKTLIEYQVYEITRLKNAFTLYDSIDPNNDLDLDLDNKKQKLMEKLYNIDWKLIIYFYKKNINNSEYKTIIRLIYEFAQLLQTGDVITLNSVDEYENDLSQELVNVSRKILYCYIQNIEQKRGRGKIKKPKKPKKAKKHTLVKKKKRKKKSTIKI